MLEHITLGPIARVGITIGLTGLGAVKGILAANVLEDNINKIIDQVNDVTKTLEMFKKTK